jgi:NAD(P)-dependent dehydrogenase (short-subunit alcohol dehydrogenase family)
MGSKKIIVTGASRGIGFELTKQLLVEGHQVITLTRSTNELDQLSTHHSKLKVIKCDLASGVDMTLAQIKLHFDQLDVLVNNAGTLINQSFIDTTDADWQHVINVNLMGPVRLIRALTPLMTRGTHVVNISSMGGYQGSSKFPGLSAYSASKGALSILTECLSVEYAHLGVHFNALCLGAVQTEMLTEAFPGYQAPVQATDMARFIADFALHRSMLFNGKIIPVAVHDPG